MCYAELKRNSSDPDSNIIYGNNPKVTITKSKRLNLHPNTHIYCMYNRKYSLDIYNCKNL
jgi:hypothetical protein